MKINLCRGFYNTCFFSFFKFLQVTILTVTSFWFGVEMLYTSAVSSISLPQMYCAILRHETSYTRACLSSVFHSVDVFSFCYFTRIRSNGWMKIPYFGTKNIFESSFSRSTRDVQKRFCISSCCMSILAPLSLACEVWGISSADGKK